MLQKVEIIIVLGGGISKEGQLPIWVMNRLEKAADLYSQGASELILLSGKGRDNFAVTEAQSMKEILIGMGLDPNVILTEELSKDTLQNAYFSRVIHLDPLKIKSAIVITNEFHNRRSKLIFDTVLYNRTKCYFYPVDDKDIQKNKLILRSETENELMTYYNKLFYSVEKGNLKDLHSVIFDKNNEFYKEYYLLGERLQDKMVLY